MISKVYFLPFPPPSAMMHWTTVGFCGFQWQSCIETWAPGTPRDISLKSHVHSYTCRSTFSNIFNLLPCSIRTFFSTVDAQLKRREDVTPYSNIRRITRVRMVVCLCSVQLEQQQQQHCLFCLFWFVRGRPRPKKIFALSL